MTIRYCVFFSNFISLSSSPFSPRAYEAFMHVMSPFVKSFRHKKKKNEKQYNNKNNNKDNDTNEKKTHHNNNNICYCIKRIFQTIKFLFDFYMIFQIFYSVEYFKRKDIRRSTTTRRNVSLLFL